MTFVTLPKTNQVGANEWADVEDNDVAIRDVVNGNLDNTNLASNAAVSHSKLASIPTGAVLLGNAGVPTATALTGDVTVGATGVTAIGAAKVTSAMLAAAVAGDGLAGGAGTALSVGVDGSSIEISSDALRVKAAGVTDTMLASPTNALYKPVAHSDTYLGGALTVNTYIILDTSVAFAPCSTNSSTPPVIWRYVSAEHAVAARSTKFRVRAQVVVGSTNPGALTLTAGLYPLTISAGAYTLGTVVTGSTVAFSSLTTNSATPLDSGDFDATALLTNPGNYVFGVVVGGATTAAGISINVELQRRNVA